MTDPFLEEKWDLAPGLEKDLGSVVFRSVNHADQRLKGLRAQLDSLVAEIRAEEAAAQVAISGLLKLCAAGRNIPMARVLAAKLIPPNALVVRMKPQQTPEAPAPESAPAPAGGKIEEEEEEGAP